MLVKLDRKVTDLYCGILDNIEANRYDLVFDQNKVNFIKLREKKNKIKALIRYNPSEPKCYNEAILSFSLPVWISRKKHQITLRWDIRLYFSNSALQIARSLFIALVQFNHRGHGIKLVNWLIHLILADFVKIVSAWIHHFVIDKKTWFLLIHWRLWSPRGAFYHSKR